MIIYTITLLNAIHEIDKVMKYSYKSHLTQLAEWQHAHKKDINILVVEVKK